MDIVKSYILKDKKIIEDIIVITLYLHAGMLDGGFQKRDM